MSASNLWGSKAYDYARPGRVDANAKRITRPSTIYYSQQFIPETFINGLSTVYDTSFESYKQNYGGIYKLFAEDQRLIMFQELKIGSIPVAQIIYNDLSGDNTVGASEKVMSPQAIYYQGEIGIGRNPESFAVYANAKYGIDVNRGIVWRLSVDGLTPISDTAFMHNYFTDKCKAILKTPLQSKIYGVYDVKFQEYIISFSQTGEVSPETLAFNEKENSWSTFYSFVPENMCQSNTGIVSFKNGSLWNHNENSTYNNFYGVQGVSEFWVYCNENPSNVKILEAVSEETDSPWGVYEITTPSGQLSNLIVDDFQEKEDNQYAPVWKDVNTPNLVPGTELFEGDVMRGRTFLLKFRKTGSDYNKIFAVNFIYIISNLHNK
jgi:hypothetical protein